MDYKNTSNPNLYHPKDLGMLGNTKKIIFFCFFIPFIISGVFLALLAMGFLDYTPEDPNSKIIIGVFAIFWNIIILFLIIGIIKTNLTKKDDLNNPNIHASPQTFQSYPNQMDRSTQYQDNLETRSIGMNSDKNKIYSILSLMILFCLVCFLFLLAVGVFLIPYAAGFFDFSLQEPIYKMVMVIFAGFWNFFIFIALIKILRSSGLILFKEGQNENIEEYF